MNNCIYKYNVSGSITVFLSLVLLLILSLILTITEGARVNCAKVTAERALSTAMDSVLAEYDGPLWDEYHIFGLYTGENRDSNQKEQLVEKLSEYMSYTFEPEKGLNVFSNNNWKLYDIKEDTLGIDNTTRLMDYQGQLLINEAVEYMKYDEIGDGVEQLLDKLSLLETPAKVSYVYEEKQKAEKELVEIDKGILELMELLDGLKTGQNGIEVSSNGTLLTTEYFVKKICNSDITKEAVGINQDSVFQALKDCYVIPAVEFETIENNFERIDAINERISEIQDRISRISESLATAQGVLQELISSINSTGDQEIDLSGICNAISAMQDAIQTSYDNIRSLEGEKQTCITNIYSIKNKLSTLISSIKPLINQSTTVIDGILRKIETVTPLVEQYERVLNNSRDFMSEETYAGMEESLDRMKRYVSVGSEGYDFTEMKVVLTKDLTVLNSVESIINQAERELLGNNSLNARSSFVEAANEINEYQISGLTLDYSTLVINNSSQGNLLSTMNDILQAGITAMVIDPAKISEKELSTDTRPSEVAALSGENTDYLEELKNFFQTAVSGSDSEGTGNLFKSFGDGSDILSMASEGINKIAEHLLYQEYIKEHFGVYTYEEDSTYRKPSALLYEQEYLLSGHLKDSQNLSSVISRILFLRTILDFVTILGDGAKRSEAYTAAAAMVGFTGLPILVSITQGLILVAWSFAEALLDVCALMKDIKVPVLKKKIMLELSELFMINRQFLQSRTNAFTDTNEPSLSYQDYLRLFLLLKNKKDLAFRSLDIMQEDIRLRYEESSFDITGCLFGYEAKMEYTIPSKFIAFPFVRKYLRTSNEGFCFTARTANSY